MRLVLKFLRRRREIFRCQITELLSVMGNYLILIYSNCAAARYSFLMFLGNSQYFYVRLYGLKEHVSR